MVLFSNVFIFLPPIGLDMDEDKIEIVVYYSAFWILYNIGFAMSNTNYLAMIPELCDSEEARMSLTLIRNSMVNCTSILAYIAALIVFNSGKLRYDPLLIRCLHCKIVHITRYLILLVYLIFMQSWVEDSGGGEEERYRNLMLMCSSVGFISSMVFHVLVKDTGKFDLEVFRIILL